MTGGTDERIPGQSRVPAGQSDPRRLAVEQRVRRQRAAVLRHVVPANRVDGCRAIEAWWREQTRPVVLDLGCGTGESSLILAEQYPVCSVLGIDKSIKRLAKNTAALDRVHLARADIEDVLAWSRAAGLRAAMAYLLCPNPWPKPGHLSRRLHARPVLHDLLAVAERGELRTNWSVYAEEFVHAVGVAGGIVIESIVDPEPVLSPFERKYRASAHAMFCVRWSTAAR